MALPASLSRKLRDTLGQDAGGDMVTWLEEERVEREKVTTELAALRAEVRAGMSDLRTDISAAKADLIKWSFVFWVGAVTAVAALAGVLR